METHFAMTGLVTCAGLSRVFYTLSKSLYIWLSEELLMLFFTDLLTRTQSSTIMIKLSVIRCKSCHPSFNPGVVSSLTYRVYCFKMSHVFFFQGGLFLFFTSLDKHVLAHYIQFIYFVVYCKSLLFILYSATILFRFVYSVIS